MVKNLRQYSDLFFYIFWTILLIGKGFGFTNKDQIFVYMTYFSLVFAGLKLLFSTYTKKELLIISGLFILGFVVWRFSNSTSVFLTIITLSACKDMQIQKLLKYTFLVKLLLFVLVTSLAMCNFIDPGKVERIVNGVYLGERYCLGYGHPNTCQYTLFMIYILFAYTYKTKINMISITIMALYNYFIYKYTDSNTGFLMCNFLLVYMALQKTKIKTLINTVMYFVSDYIYIILVPISFVCCYLSTKMNLLNNLGTLSARFWTASNIVFNNPLNIFGSTVMDTDFGFIKILYSYGLIVLALYVFIHTYLLKKLKEKDMAIEYFSLVLMALYSLLESYSASILMNMTLFLILYFTKQKELDERMSVFSWCSTLIHK